MSSFDATHDPRDFPTSQSLKIQRTAVKFLGIDASPADLAPDDVGCAETFCDIQLAAGFKMPLYLSTTDLLNKEFLASKKWIRVGTPREGDAIIAATGEIGAGKNGITHGHVGIVMGYSGGGAIVASNNSYTGTFDENYTFASFVRRYRDKGGYTVYLFRRIAD